MNCKPGDLAIVVGSEKYSGRLVEVLCLAPDEEFTLPNGTPHVRPSESPAWVVNVLGSPIEVTYANGATVGVMQGVALDRKLRPLPGKLEDEEIEDELAIS